MFGKIDGRQVHLYTLTNAHGLVVKVTSYGATVTSLLVPDRQGRLDDVVLGFDTLDGYLGARTYFGASIGRVANRIQGATFTLDGVTYKLGSNDGDSHLHGGPQGWDRRLWEAEPAQSAEGPSLRLWRVSPDGEEGYPGTVRAQVTYTLTERDELKVAFEATTDKATPVNMAHHSYWNLRGHASGTIVDHVLTLPARAYTPGTPMIPDGRVAPVAGTPLDFTSPKPIGRDLLRVQIGQAPPGYDHNFVVDGPAHQLREAARLEDPASGRAMTLLADQPGIQVYTSNWMDGSTRGKGGVAYPQYAAICLESQAFPNAINVPAWAAGVVLRPGQTYRHTMIHRFTTVASAQR